MRLQPLHRWQALRLEAQPPFSKRWALAALGHWLQPHPCPPALRHVRVAPAASTRVAAVGPEPCRQHRSVQGAANEGPHGGWHLCSPCRRRRARVHSSARGHLSLCPCCLLCRLLPACSEQECEGCARVAGAVAGQCDASQIATIHAAGRAGAGAQKRATMRMTAPMAHPATLPGCLPFSPVCWTLLLHRRASPAVFWRWASLRHVRNAARASLRCTGQCLCVIGGAGVLIDATAVHRSIAAQSALWRVLRHSARICACVRAVRP